MATKGKSYLLTLGLAAQLFFFGYPATEPLGATDNASEQEIFDPDSVPEKDRLTVVSFLPVILEGEIAGGVAVYDDPATERPADLLELYNSIGNLLAFSWFDRFGIQRAAVDRGLLEEADELEGIFVPLLEGDLI